MRRKRRDPDPTCEVCPATWPIPARFCGRCGGLLSSAASLSDTSDAAAVTLPRSRRLGGAGRLTPQPAQIVGLATAILVLASVAVSTGWGASFVDVVEIGVPATAGVVPGGPLGPLAQVDRGAQVGPPGSVEDDVEARAGPAGPGCAALVACWDGCSIPSTLPPGASRWCRGELVGTSGLVTDGGLVFAVTAHGATALQREDGAVAWQRKLELDPDAAALLTSARMVGRALVLTRPDGTLTALRARDGTPAWQGPEGTTGPLAIDGRLGVVGTREGALLALSLTDGRELWRRPGAADGRTRPVVLGGSVLSGTPTGITATRVEDGSEHWSTATAAPEPAPTEPGPRGELVGLAVAPGEVMATWADGTVRSLRSADGSVAWQATVPGGIVDGPVVFDGRVWVITGRRRLVGLERRGGELTTDLALTGAVSDVPSLGVHEGHLVVTMFSRVHLIDPTTLDDRVHDLGRPVRKGPMVVGQVLYLSLGDTVVALEVAAPGS